MSMGIDGVNGLSMASGLFLEADGGTGCGIS